jgi:uncharacterized GH25 family protein
MKNTMHFGFQSLAAVLAAAGSCALPLCAHDFWIEPSRALARPGDTVDLVLRTGEHFHGEAFPRNPQMIKKFVASQGGALRAVAGNAGQSPAGRVVASDPGPLVIGYQSHWLGLTHDNAKFDAYLALEGLDAVLKERNAAGAANAEVSEVFMRCAKSLVRVIDSANGSEAGRPADVGKPMGCPLEIVPLSDPNLPEAAQDFSVRILHEGKPLPGVLVMALNRANGMQKQSVRSGADGIARFSLKPSGEWLIKAVHMVKAAPSLNADWASYWASLTFETGNTEAIATAQVSSASLN